jgi:hypothetical protein
MLSEFNRSLPNFINKKAESQKALLFYFKEMGDYETTLSYFARRKDK